MVVSFAAALFGAVILHKTSTMINNTTIFLATIGVLGILLQVIFRKFISDKNIHGRKFIRRNLLVLAISVVTVIAASLLSNSISSLQLAGRWLAFGTFTIGYMTYSLLSKFMHAGDN